MKESHLRQKSFAGFIFSARSSNPLFPPRIQCFPTELQQSDHWSEGSAYKSIKSDVIMLNNNENINNNNYVNEI